MLWKEALKKADEVLRITALAEQQSEHPLGKAIWNAYAEKGGKNEPVKDFKVLAGQGVSAEVSGMQVLVGKEDFMASQGIKTEEFEEAGKKESDGGATVVYAA